MAFDAGAITARVEIDADSFNRSLDRVEARVARLVGKDYKINIVADLDQSSVERVRQALGAMDRRVTEESRRRGGFLGGLGGLFATREAQRAASQQGGGFLRNIGSAAGPGLNVGMLGARGALIGAGVGIAGAALPAITAPLLAGGVGALGTGVAALGARALIGTKQDPGQLYAPAQKALQQLENMVKRAAQPLVAPLQQVFHQLPGIISQITPAMRQMFAGAGTLILPVVHGLADLAKNVMPLLGQAFRAAAPFMRPLLAGLSNLLTGLLPGVITLIHAATPAIRVLSQFLGSLGRAVGQMLKEFAPAIRASSVVLKAVGDVLVAIFPIVGKLAGVLAGALAPVVRDIARIFRALSPVLVIIGKLFADLAGAVLRDVVALLSAVAGVIVKAAPVLGQFAKALSGVFDMLENSGVFGVLAQAVEQLAKPFGHLILVVLRALIPIIPPIIKFITQLGVILATGLAKAVASLLPPLEHLVLKVLQALVPLLPVILPLLTTLAGIFTAAVVDVIAGVAQALDDIITAIPVGVLQAVGVALGIIVGIIKLWGVYQTILDAELFANPIGLVALAIIGLSIAAIELWRHWRTVWTFVKSIAEDAWHFLTHGWGQWLVPGLTLIRLAVQFVRDHWKQAWDDIKQAGQDFWHWIWDDFGAKILNFMTNTLPNAFQTAVKFIGQHWTDIQNVVKAPVKFVIGTVLDGLIGAFDWIASKLGFGSQVIHKVDVSNWQTGGRIPGYGGGDRHLALLEGGEAVISKETTSAHAATLSAWGVPGFQQGGLAGAHAGGATPGQIRHGQTVPTPLLAKVGDMGRIIAALATGNHTALTNAVFDLFPHGTGGAIRGLANLLTDVPAKALKDVVGWLFGHYSGSGWPFPGGKNLSELRRVDEGQDMQYPGTSKVPVFAIMPGVVTTFGPDPGGFGVSYPGLTLEAPYKGFRQIYYGHTQPIGKAGHHVGVGEAIGSTFGPTSGGDAAGLPNWLEIGFWPPNWSNGPIMRDLLLHGSGTAGPGSARGGSWTIGGLRNLWDSVGGSPGMAHIMSAIAMAESGGRAWIVNSIGASGLWQVMPYSQMVAGDLRNPYVNARNAVAILRAQGLRAWETYTNGAYRQFMDGGGWLMPGATVAMNATGMREAVLTPRESQAFTVMARAAHEMVSGRSGGARRSQIAEVMNIMLPEGATVAQMMRELVFRLRAAELSGTAGAIR